MKDYNIQKINFERYVGTRKYKLSFWGLSHHIDWMILVLYVAIGFILIVSNGYFEYKNTEKELSEEIFVPRKVQKFDVNKIDNLLYEYKAEEGGVVKDVSPVDQKQ